MSNRNINSKSSKNKTSKQSLNLNDEKILELIKPYQEKIKDLQEEISKKDLEITLLKYKLYQYTDDNKTNNKIKDINSSDNNKFIRINFKYDNGTNVFDVPVQCKSDDKLEIAINHFLVFTVIKKEEYDFLITKKIKKRNLNLTAEENGLIGNNYYISVRKKLNYENQKDDSSSDEEDALSNFNNNILGNLINIMFKGSSGVNIIIQSGTNNTVKDLVMKYLQKIGEPLTSYKKGFNFIFKAKKLNIDDKTLEQIGLKEKSEIVVVNAL